MRTMVGEDGGRRGYEREKRENVVAGLRKKP